MKSVAIIKGKLVYEKLMLNKSIFIDLMSGFFPKIMRRNICRTNDSDCRLCKLSDRCAYSYIFEPAMPGEKALVVSLPDIKIPFAFKWFPEQNQGEFILSMFGRCSIFIYDIIQTLKRIGEMGLGHEKMKFEIGELESLGADLKKTGVLKEGVKMSEHINNISLETIADMASDLPSLSMKFGFDSDFDLMRSNRDLKRNELFPVLYKRVRDRLKALYVLYLDEELPPELKGLSDRASDIINISDKSDILEFKGNLSPFRYLFLMGSYFNVGRRCAFGKGSYRLIL